MAKYLRKPKGKVIKPTLFVFCEGEQCIEKFERQCKDYKKGSICNKLRAKLTEDMGKAVARAKKLTLYNSPSTSVYLLLEELNNL